MNQMLKCQNKQEQLKRILNSKCPICVYGMGYLGKRLHEIIPGLFGREAEYYCDSNDEKVLSQSYDNMMPILRDELLKHDRTMLVFILVDDPYDLMIEKDLAVNSNICTVTLRELAEMDYIKEMYYGKELFEKFLLLDVMNA